MVRNLPPSRPFAALIRPQELGIDAIGNDGET